LSKVFFYGQDGIGLLKGDHKIGVIAQHLVSYAILA